MKTYLAKIDIACLSFADIFLVRALNKKEATQKVYDYCKDSFDYKKCEIIVENIDELFEDNDFVAEIH